MESSGSYRYEYLAESQKRTSNQKIDHDHPSHSSRNEDGKIETAERISHDDCFVEDSLMDFITEYFQGDVIEDFTEISDVSFNTQSNDSASKPATSSSNDSSMMEFADNAFMDSSSDINTTNEMLSSSCSETDNSVNTCLRRPSTGMVGIASPTSMDRSIRRKSISYEIRFMNSKESNGKVKIQIFPRAKEKTAGGEEHNFMLSSADQTTTSTIGQLQRENSSLRKCIADLERKLSCVEKESERIVNELTRIIERKNETISHLELEIAGIKFESGC